MTLASSVARRDQDPQRRLRGRLVPRRVRANGRKSITGSRTHSAGRRYHQSFAGSRDLPVAVHEGRTGLTAAAGGNVRWLPLRACRRLAS